LGGKKVAFIDVEKPLRNGKKGKAVDKTRSVKKLKNQIIYINKNKRKRDSPKSGER